MQMPSVIYAFCLEGEPVSCTPFGHGHINKTFLITTNTGAEYILQNINQYVFPHPDEVMENVSAVTNFIRSKDPDPRHTIHFLPTQDGQYFYLDENKKYWRMYSFIGGFCLDMPETEEDFYQSALAFGRFQTLLWDFPAESLYYTIPNFHNTVDRYEKLRLSAAADVCSRCAEVQPELDYMFSQEELACTLQRLLEAGKLPLRVTHNDTKLNNVLLDRHTRQALCVLDLDTVMPGLSLHDFGDSVRFGAATAAEDTQDLDSMTLDLHLFEIYTLGFLETATTLTADEIRYLPLSAFVIALELSTRFLKDYLDGDLYFSIAYPTHNLVRARAQMKLAQDILQKLPKMEAIVAQVYEKIQHNNLRRD